jgi:hypothetical protein
VFGTDVCGGDFDVLSIFLQTLLRENFDVLSKKGVALLCNQCIIVSIG